MATTPLAATVERIISAYNNKMATAETLDADFLRRWESLKAEIISAFDETKSAFGSSPGFEITISTTFDLSAYLILKITSDGKSGQLEYKPNLVERKIGKHVTIRGAEPEEAFCRIEELTRSVAEKHIEQFLRKVLEI